MTNQGIFRKYRDIKFSQERLNRIGRAAQIIEDYERRGFAMSLRQLYYQLVSRGIIPNADREYGRLGDDVTDGRMAGLISWTSIEDRGRNLMGNRTWVSPQAAIKEVRDDYRTDKWAPQPCRPEVWVEKAALEGVVGAICGKLDVDFFSCKGYNSASEQWRAGRRFASYLSKGQRPVVLHLGDHDPSGIDMTRDNEARLSMFAEMDVEVRRLALNMNQVEKYAPPPNPAKITDSRAEEYIQRFGRKSWELDALSPKVITSVLESEIKSYIDMDLWRETKTEQTEKRALLASLYDRWDDVKPFLEKLRDE